VIVLAIDPGTTHSAWVVYEIGNSSPLRAFSAKTSNEQVLRDTFGSVEFINTLVLERMVWYGPKTPFGAETIETIRWSGRFEQAFCGAGNACWLTSQDVKKNLGVPRGLGDSGVMHALLDRWGGRERAVGRKAEKGPLYGLSSHAWRALGLAVTYADRLAEGKA
jgi:hypothetical protein